jgi:hypothetical protein
VRGYGISFVESPLTRFALDDAPHRQEQIDLSPAGRGEVRRRQTNSINSHRLSCISPTSAHAAIAAGCVCALGNGRNVNAIRKAPSPTAQEPM